MASKKEVKLSQYVGNVYKAVAAMTSELNRVNFIDTDVYCIAYALEGNQPEYDVSKINKEALQAAISAQIEALNELSSNI